MTASITEPRFIAPILAADGPAHADSSAVARTDEDLAADAQAGSHPSFGELVRRFEGRLVGFLIRRTGSSDAATELAQETLVRAWHSLPRYNPRLRFSTWLFTIANRLAVDHYRDRKRRGVAMIPLSEPAAPAVREPLETHEMNGHVWTRARAVLTAEQLSALWLRYGADMDIADIARVLRRTSVGVRVLLFRARERLARELQSPDSETSSHARPDPPSGGNR
ncbi:MAG TPA: sigma-70 family RNA polymerase sigma factor [Phycisphaerales bacterium]|nr:sigma-70 family RNA polymerase sigma factor [Phycisphaerales bacterium]